MDSVIAAVTALSDLTLRAFAATAKADPRLVVARERLGTDRFADVATATLRGALKRDLVDGAEERREELAVAGGFAAKTLMMGIVAETVSAVLAASEGPQPGDRVRAFGRVEVEVVRPLERMVDGTRKGELPILVRRLDSGVEAIAFASQLEDLGVTR